MDFYKDIKCPYCNNDSEINLEEYIEGQSGHERQMGTEREYTIECEEFKCSKCRKSFKIKGSIWEYPEGAYNYDDVKAIHIDEN